MDVVETRRMTTKPKVVMTELDQNIIDILGSKGFCVTQNLFGYLSVSKGRLSDRINRLIAKGLVDAATEQKPYVYRLTHKACVMYGYNLRRWPKSLTPVQRYCLRNQVEIQLREEFSQARILSADYLKKYLINNAIGEYVFEVWSTPESPRQRLLIVIDDYGMPPSRLKRIWERRHCVAQGGNLTYGDFVHDWRLYVCDEVMMRRHFEYAKRHKLRLDLEFIEPFWGIG